MFDIGQNDLAGSFYSMTLDQVLASIPTILLEFETGIKVQEFMIFNIFHYQDKKQICRFLTIDPKTLVLLIVQKLYDEGARNFWIHNTGPLGCLPQNIAKFGTDPSKLDELGCLTTHNQASKLLNLQLHALCTKLRLQYTDANVTFIDIFTIKSNLIANYSKYGW